MRRRRECAHGQQIAVACGNHAPSTSRTNAGALCGDDAGEYRSGGSRRAALDFLQMREGMIDGGEIFLHDCFAALAVGLLMALLICSMASSRGSTPLMAKKQVCMIVLMRRAHSGLARHLVAVDDVELDFLSMISCCILRGSWSQTSSAAIGRVEQEDCAGLAAPSTSIFSRKLKLVAGDETGAGDEVSGANRVGAEAQVRDGHRAGFF